MHTVTFYSYKGGTGRSMALMNVAAILADRGKKVLVVDFDLEAPGITTFDLARPSKARLGLVDFVRDYLKTNEAPSVDDFLFRANRGRKQGAGDLWVMPAGKLNENYGDNLNS